MPSTSSSGYHRLSQERTSELWKHRLVSITITVQWGSGFAASVPVSEAIVTTTSAILKIDTFIVAG